MSTENPYQSPKSDSTPEPAPLGDLVHQRRPTWRFWLLALIGALAPVGFFGAVMINSRMGSAENSVGILISGLILLAYLGSCVFIFRYWNAPAEKWRRLGPGSGAGFVHLSIWILGIIAAPTAFFTTCTPIGYGGAIWMYANWQYEQGIMLAMGLGVIVGAVCAALTIWLARKVWLDALGWSKKSKTESIQRPTTKPQAREPTDGE